MEKAIRSEVFDTAAPSLIFWPSLTGRDPGRADRNHSSLSRERETRTSSKRSGPIRR